MAQIIKYNSAKESNSKRSGNSTSFSVGATLNSSTSSTDITNVTLNANSTIWGQKYTGDNDITGTLKITEGDLIVKKPVWNEDNDDDDDEGFVDENDTDGMTGEGNAIIEGNLNVGEKSTLNVVVATDITSDSVYGKTSYINYPNATSEKKNIAELIKKNADDIATNKTSITNLTTTVNGHTTTINNHTTAISNLQTSVSNNATNIANNTTNITNNTTEINALKQAVENLTGDIGDISFESETIIDNKVKWNGIATNENESSGFVFKRGSSELTINPQYLQSSKMNNSGGYDSFSASKDSNGSATIGSGNLNWDYSADITLDCGSFPAGSVFRIKPNSITYSATANLNGGGSITNVTSNLNAVYIYRNGSTMVSATSTSQINDLYKTNYYITNGNGDNYKVVVRVKGSFTFTATGGAMTAQPSVNCTASVQVAKKILPSVEIRPNGIFVCGGFDKYIFANEQVTRIKFANAAIQFSEAGVYIQNPNSTTEQFVPINSVKKIRRITNQNYTIQDDDEIVINYGKTTDLDWYLPKTTWTGRQVTIIDIANDSSVKLHITANNENLFYNNSYNLSNRVDINNTARTFIFDGTYWIVMAN